jgi:hypothetical protein
MKVNKLTSIGLVSAFVLTATTASASTIVFGMNGTGWATQGVGDNQSRNETATIVADGFTFELGINFSSANVGIATSGELSEGSRSTWRNNGSQFTFTLNVVDNNATQDLASLSVNSFLTNGMNRNGEQITVSESASANTAVIGHSGNPQTITASQLYTTNSLSPLTLANVGTWDMIMENTGDNQITGIHSFLIDYALTPIPEPGTYALLAGCAALGFVMLRRRG